MCPGPLVASLLLAAASADPPPAILTLADALAELDRESLTMAQARARVEETAGISRQALASALPVLGVAAGYTRNSDDARAPLGALLSVVAPRAPPVPDLVIQPLEVFSASASLRLPLVAASAWADVAAARAAEGAARASAAAVRLGVRAALVQAAWLAGAAEDVVAAAERAVASADEQARSAQRAVDAGTGVPLAVLQARTEAVKRRSDLARARAERERSRLALGVLLGRPSPVAIALPPAMEREPREVAALARDALARRPELEAQAAAARSGELQVRAAWLRLVPQVSASAAAFAQDVPLPTGKRDGWRVTAELSWPLYDGGFRYGRARQAEGAAAGARAALAAGRLQVQQEVADAARDLDLARERLGLAQEQSRLAAEGAATARRSFEAGVVGSLDVLDANDRLYAAEVGLADARARVGVARAALDRAAGLAEVAPGEDGGARASGGARAAAGGS